MLQPAAAGCWRLCVTLPTMCYSCCLQIGCLVLAVCSKGFYEAAPDATSCTRCPANSFCTGGDKVANPISRGSLSACGTMLITRNTGARTASDCVSSAGYAMTSPTGATPCARSTYAPQFNRLTRCMKCQGGLEEPLASNLTDGMRSSKRVVCSEYILCVIHTQHICYLPEQPQHASLK